jgi:hypothetical protein
VRIPFCGATYTGRSTNIDSARCINFYPEVGAGDEVKTEPILIGTPGTKVLYSFPLGETRMLYSVADKLFTVVGFYLYELFHDAATDTWRRSAKRGAFPEDTGEVLAADNGLSGTGTLGGNQLLLVTNKKGYIFNIVTQTLTDISSYANFPSSPTGVTYQDGYFVVTNDSMKFSVSNLFDGLTWGALAYASAFTTPDNIQVPVSLNQQLYIVKNQSTEVFYNSGTATTQGSPFVRVQGAVFPYGTPAPRSVAYGLNTIFFLANQGHSGTAGLAGVAMLDGYTPSLISPPSITYRITQMSNITDARGYVYLDEGHAFYVLTDRRRDPGIRPQYQDVARTLYEQPG